MSCREQLKFSDSTGGPAFNLESQKSGGGFFFFLHACNGYLLADNYNAYANQWTYWTPQSNEKDRPKSRIIFILEEEDKLFQAMSFLHNINHIDLGTVEWRFYWNSVIYSFLLRLLMIIFEAQIIRMRTGANSQIWSSSGITGGYVCLLGAHYIYYICWL